MWSADHSLRNAVLYEPTEVRTKRDEANNRISQFCERVKNRNNRLLMTRVQRRHNKRSDVYTVLDTDGSDVTERLSYDNYQLDALTVIYS